MHLTNGAFRATKHRIGPYILGLLAVVSTVGCGGDSAAEPTTLAFAETSPAVVTVENQGGALVEPTATGSLDEAIEVLDSLDEDDLPSGLRARLDLMLQWLRGVEPARNSGNGAYTGGRDSGFSMEIFVDTGRRDLAAELCPLYVSAARAYGGELAQPTQITLSGWVPTDAGVFADPGWAVVSCDMG